MAMAQAAYANNSASVFQARFDRYINDVLASPMRAWEVNLGLNVGGAVRALAIGAGLLAVAIPLTGVPVRDPLVLFAARGAAADDLLRVRRDRRDPRRVVGPVGVRHEPRDPAASFLGGVFYSVGRLPSPWQEISHVNPLYYLIDAVRHGFLGTSDVAPAISLGVGAVLAAACVAWSARLFATGRRLKP